MGERALYRGGNDEFHGDSLAFHFTQSEHWGLASATHAIPLPQPKPRTMREHFIVPSICSKDVASAEWSGVWNRKSSL